MQYSQGSIQSLSSAGATCFALCIAFLGIWGFQSPSPWCVVHLIVLVPLVISCLGFGFTPLLVTRPVESPERIARIVYSVSVVLLMFAVVAALVIAYTYPDQTHPN